MLKKQYLVKKLKNDDIIALSCNSGINSMFSYLSTVKLEECLILGEIESTVSICLFNNLTNCSVAVIIPTIGDLLKGRVLEKINCINISGILAYLQYEVKR